jgi:PKD repeat protein
MKPKSRPLLALATLLVILVLFAVQRKQVAPLYAASYTGLAQISEPLQLDLAISPPVGAPRDTLQLQVILTNNNDSLISPDILLRIPSNLQVDTGKLPAGATLNITDNSLRWLAVVPGHGATKEMTLPLKVTSADLAHPEEEIEAVLRYQGHEQSTTALIWIGIPPSINGITSPSHVSVGQPIQLQVDAHGPGPLFEIWDLGDGRRVPLNSPTIVYPAAGVYNVTVTVKNTLGSATHTEQLTIVPHVAASFRPEDETPGLGGIVNFVNESGGQMPVQYTWQFGDGTTSNEARPQHQYTEPGTYEVRLLVENEFGRSEISRTITVGLPPTADILVDNSAPAGELLTGLVVNDQAGTEYAWAMGDGREYDGTKINHAYRQTGDYYVTMTANNEFGSTQVGRWIHVDPGDLKIFLPVANNLSGLTIGSSADVGTTTSDLIQAAVDLDGLFKMEPLEISADTSSVGQLLLYVNEARRQFDLPPLKESIQLSAAAQKHADDMSTTKHTQHVGSDGSSPADRQLWHGYIQGYAGEATAWGFEDPRQAVEFWVNSPSHRPIILNRYATEVGLGHTADYSAPSVWYWTAEFGNSFVLAEMPVLRVMSPDENLEALNSDLITFTWNWSQQLSPADQFTIYMVGSGAPIAVGSIQNPVLGTRYVLPLKALDIPDLLGTFQWQIKLENNRGLVLAESEPREITINPDPALPTPTPQPTIEPTIEPTPIPTATPTSTAVPSSPTPRPTNPPLPRLVTATPLPRP